MQCIINPLLAPRLQKLMHKCNCRTIDEMLNLAVTLLDVATEKAEQGKLVGSLDETAQHFEILDMPVFKFLAIAHRPTVTAVND